MTEEQEKIRGRPWVCEDQSENGHSTRTWGYDVEEIFEVIHPDFRQPPIVLVDDLARSAREAVRSGLPENVADVRTRDDFQRAATLPDLQKTRSANGL